MNSAAIARPALVAEAAEKFGSQCVVVAVDARATAPGRWEVFTHGGRQPTGLDAVRLVPPGRRPGRRGDPADQHGPRRHRQRLRRRPACARCAARSACPVVASGGVGTLDHFVAGAQAGATGLLAASVFHFGTFTIPQVKAALHAAGLPVRRPAPAAPGTAA